VHGLLSGVEIDDTETSMRQTGLAVRIYPSVVGASVAKHFEHFPEETWFNYFSIQFYDARDPTHNYLTFSASRKEESEVFSRTTSVLSADRADLISLFVPVHQIVTQQRCIC
jgi:hypothetical protein